jgi:hypothetical protein
VVAPARAVEDVDDARVGKRRAQQCAQPVHGEQTSRSSGTTLTP